MKFLYSSSSPSSSINANLYNSKNATAGCLAGILRRLLCSGSLPTHPSDHVRDSGQCGFFESVECDNVRSLKSNDKIKRPASPGIVARLMGLSSMPDADSTPNSIRRSRSMNSVDYGSVQKRHGRLKTSLSFREASSTSLQVENEEFLILSFENGGETTELESNPTKPEDIRRMHSCGKQRVDENQDGVIKEVTNEEKSKWSSFGEYYDESSRVKVSHVTPDLDLEAIKLSQCTNHKGDEGKLTKKKKKKKKRKNSQSASNKVESESESENSSPVSVLEVGEFDLSDEVPRSGLFPLLNSLLLLIYMWFLYNLVSQLSLYLSCNYFFIRVIYTLCKEYEYILWSL